MAGLKKFFKKKNLRRQSASSAVSTGSEQHLESNEVVFGYRNVKEKELPKLHKAAWGLDLNKLKQLAKKADINQQDKERRTALHYAAAQGHREIVQWICTNRANVNIRDSDGRSPLMKAVENQRTDIVDVLLTHGAEANVVDLNQTTPIHLAAASGSKDIASLLLDRDARIDPQDKDRVAPLHIAAALGDQDFVDFLIREYASINIKDNQGRTPLMGAASEGHIGIVRLLLEEGADVDKKDSQGLSAYDYAINSGHNRVGDLFLAIQNANEQRKSKDSNSNITNQTRVPTPQGLSSNIFGGPALNIGNESDKEDDSQTKSVGADSWCDSDTELDVSEKPKTVTSQPLQHQQPSDISQFKDKPTKKKPNLAMALRKMESLEKDSKTDDVGTSKETEFKQTASKDGNNLQTNSPSNASVTTVPVQGSSKPILPSTPLTGKPNAKPNQENAKGSTGDDFLGGAALDASKSDTSGWESDDGNDVSDDAVLAALSGNLSKTKTEEKSGGNLEQKSNKLKGLLPDFLAGRSKKDVDDFSFLSSSEGESNDNSIGEDFSLHVNEDKHENSAEERKSEDKPVSLESQLEKAKSTKSEEGTLVQAQKSQESERGPKKPEGASDWDSSGSEAEEDPYPLFNSINAKKSLQELQNEGPTVTALDKKLPSLDQVDHTEHIDEDFSVETDQEDILPQLSKAPAAKAKAEKATTKTSEQEKSARRKQFEDLGLDFGSSLSSVSDPEGLSETESQQEQLFIMEEKAGSPKGKTDLRLIPEQQVIENDETKNGDYRSKYNGKQESYAPPLVGEKDCDVGRDAESLEIVVDGLSDASSDFTIEESEVEEEDHKRNISAHSKEQIIHKVAGDDPIDEQDIEEDLAAVNESHNDLIFDEDEYVAKDIQRQEEWDRLAKEREERYAQEIREELMKELIDNKSENSEILSEDDFSLHSDYTQNREENKANVVVEGNEAVKLTTGLENQYGVEDEDIDMSEQELKRLETRAADEKRRNMEGDKSEGAMLLEGASYRQLKDEFDEDGDEISENMGVPPVRTVPLPNGEHLSNNDFSQQNDDLEESVSFGSGSEEELKMLQYESGDNWGTNTLSSRDTRLPQPVEEEIEIKQAGKVEASPRVFYSSEGKIKEEQVVSPAHSNRLGREEEEGIKKHLLAMIESERTRERTQSPTLSPRKQDRFNDSSHNTKEGSRIPVFKGRSGAVKAEEQKPNKKLENRSSNNRDKEKEEQELRKLHEEKLRELERKREEEEELLRKKSIEKEEEEKKWKEREEQRKLDEQKRVEEQKAKEEEEQRKRESKWLEEEEKFKHRLLEEEKIWKQKEKQREEEERKWKEREEARETKEKKRIEEEKRKEEEARRKKEQERLEDEERFRQRLRQIEEAKLREIESERERLSLAIERETMNKEKELRDRLEAEEKRRREILEQEDRQVKQALALERERLEQEFLKREQQLTQLLKDKEENTASLLKEIEKKRDEERLLREQELEEVEGTKKALLEAQIREKEHQRLQEEEALQDIMIKRAQEEEKIRQLVSSLEEKENSLKKKEEELEKKMKEEEEKRKTDSVIEVKKANQLKNGPSQVKEDIFQAATVGSIETENLIGTQDSLTDAERKLQQARKRGKELKALLQSADESTEPSMKIPEAGMHPSGVNGNHLNHEEDFSDFSDAVIDDIRPTLENRMEFIPNGVLGVGDDDSDSFDIDSPLHQYASLRLSQKFSTPNDLLVQNGIKGYSGKVPNPSPIHPVTSSTNKVIFPGSPFMTKSAKDNHDISSQGQDSLVRLQDALRDTKRQLDHFKEKSLAQENFKRELEADVEELQKTVDILSKSQAEAEHHRLDMDLEIRSLRYKLEQETEGKNVAEGLIQQLKDQMMRLEEKLAKEFEARQTIEMGFRKQESDLKTRENLIQQLEADLSDLRLVLDHEKESRTIQEDLYKEQLKQHELVLHEAQKTSHEHALTVTQLEELDKSKRTADNDVNSLKLELSRVKGELSRVLSQYEELKASSEHELKRAREKLQEKSDTLNTSERNLFQVQMQLDTERSTGQAETSRLANAVDSERAAKQQLEVEISSLKNRLELANAEIGRSEKLRSNLERDIQATKDESHKVKSKIEKEYGTTREQLQVANAKLSASQERVESLENELQGMHREVTEKSGLLALSQRDAEYQRNTLEQIDKQLRDEKEQKHRLTSKLEGASSKINSLQKELEKLQEEVDSSVKINDSKERSIVEAQEKFNASMNSLKQDLEKERAVFEIKITGLQESNERLREDLLLSREGGKEKDTTIRKLEQEINELNKQFSSVKASSDVLSQTREHVESEKQRLHESIMELQNKLHSVEQERDDLRNHLNSVQEQLDASLLMADDTKTRLVSRSDDLDAVIKHKSDLERDLSKVRIEKTDLESILKEERKQAEMLLDELRESNQARESLESLLANIKSSNMQLEEKLQSETVSRAQREREAQEHKVLWESEVKSRSKIGMKIIEMEREIQSLKDQLQEEHKKTQEAFSHTQQAETKIRYYDERMNQHQQEVTALRNKLKQYQRKVREYESKETRLPNLHAEFDRERQAMGSNMANLRRQIDQQNERLRNEQEQRARAELATRQSQQELTDLKTKEKILTYEKDKLEKQNRLLEEEVGRLKTHYDSNFIDKNELESYKQDIATKARIELNQKLQEVNRHLEDQALVRETYDRIRNETDSKSKRELEDTIMSLKSELSSVKSSLQQGLAKHSTVESEAKRFKELYEDEMKTKERLSDRLAKANEKAAESAAKLNLERTRTQRLMDLASTVGRISPNKVLSPGLVNGGVSYTQPERDITTSTPLRTGLDLKQLSVGESEAMLSPFSRHPGLATKDFTTPLARRGYLS